MSKYVSPHQYVTLARILWDRLGNYGTIMYSDFGQQRAIKQREVVLKLENGQQVLGRLYEGSDTNNTSAYTLVPEDCTLATLSSLALCSAFEVPSITLN